MSKRRTADEVARMLKDVDRDLAKGLTVADICRKNGIAVTTYYRWRERHDPATVDTDRRCRQLEVEIERLKRLVAELLLDKTMLQDIAKKSGEPRPATGCGRLLERRVSSLPAAGVPGHGAVALDSPLPPNPSRRRAGFDSPDPTAGKAFPTLRIPESSRDADLQGLVGEPETGASPLERIGATKANKAAGGSGYDPVGGPKVDWLSSAAVSGGNDAQVLRWTGAAG
jgi:putative transposase